MPTQAYYLRKKKAGFSYVKKKKKKKKKHKRPVRCKKKKNNLKYITLFCMQHFPVFPFQTDRFLIFLSQSLPHDDGIISKGEQNSQSA